MENIQSEIGYVYMITSPSNRIYIGSTQDTEERWKYYIKLRCKRQIKLYNSFIKYGVENHIFEKVWIGDVNNMLRNECIIGNWYEALDVDKGLNLKLPKIDDVYQCVSQETRERMSISQSKRTHSQETKYKQSISKLGIKRSQETKDKLSLFHMGKTASDETKLKMSLKKGKNILQFSLTGVFIKEWRSGVEASKSVNRSHEAILACCRGIQKSSAGFIWKFKL